MAPKVRKEKKHKIRRVTLSGGLWESLRLVGAVRPRRLLQRAEALLKNVRARGKGVGKWLIEKCHQQAIQFGFNKIYLETMPELTRAIPMYEQEGFRYLDGPMGNSGHFGCAIQMIRNL